MIHTHTHTHARTHARTHTHFSQAQTGGLFHRPYVELRGEMARLKPKRPWAVEWTLGDMAVKMNAVAVSGRGGRPDGQLRVPKGGGGGMALTARSQLRGALGCDVLWLDRLRKVAVAANGEWSSPVCECFARRNAVLRQKHVATSLRNAKFAVFSAASWPFTAILLTSHTHPPTHTQRTPTHPPTHTHTHTHTHPPTHTPFAYFS